VLNFKVLLQVSQLGEGVVANFAGEGSLASVLFKVIFEVIGLVERLHAPVHKTLEVEVVFSCARVLLRECSEPRRWIAFEASHSR
jgi:hypothetical protein